MFEENHFPSAGASVPLVNTIKINFNLCLVHERDARASGGSLPTSHSDQEIVCRAGLILELVFLGYNLYFV